MSEEAVEYKTEQQPENGNNNDKPVIVFPVTGTSLEAYKDRTEVREIASRLMALHHQRDKVGEAGMMAVAQLALMSGANPLPYTNEIHVWPDRDGKICLDFGINFFRRRALEWGGVAFQYQPRQMRPEERAEYGVPDGHLGAICSGVRADQMREYYGRGQGMTPNAVFAMLGRIGIATVNPGHAADKHAKRGRPLVWTVLKRAEKDLLRKLFPIFAVSPKESEGPLASISQTERHYLGLSDRPEANLENVSESLYGNDDFDGWDTRETPIAEPWNEKEEPEAEAESETPAGGAADIETMNWGAWYSLVMERFGIKNMRAIRDELDETLGRTTWGQDMTKAELLTVLEENRND